jgi:alkylation response protein AidB-like acyl-CoA dehydrogenase
MTDDPVRFEEIFFRPSHKRSQIAALAGKLGRLPSACEADIWPTAELQECLRVGVQRWFVPIEVDGEGWSEPDLNRVYVAIARTSLVTAFVLTQRFAAVSRIAAAPESAACQEWMPRLLEGDFTTVGFSHLTTSRQHLAQPALLATPSSAPEGFMLNGESPWVTGGEHAACIVVGATTPDGQQILAVVDARQTGVSVGPPLPLVALTGSWTGPVSFKNVFVPSSALLAGPVENVMKPGLGPRPGGLATSALALGSSLAAIDHLQFHAQSRSELGTPAEAFEQEAISLGDDLIAAADGTPHCTNENLRARANSLALRTSQAALGAAKGAGFVVDHPAGRLAREALFFLVWSCPNPVLQANLCELAGLA